MVEVKPNTDASQTELKALYSALNKFAMSSPDAYGLNFEGGRLYRLRLTINPYERVLESILIPPELANLIEKGEVQDVGILSPQEVICYFLNIHGEVQQARGHAVVLTGEEAKFYLRKGLERQVIEEIRERPPKQRILSSEAINLTAIVNNLDSRLFRVRG